MSVMQGPNDGTADLTDATKRWLTDEAAKTQAWVDANQRPDDRVPVRHDTEADDIDRAERAFWDSIDYSKLGDAKAAEDGAGS